MNIAGEDVMRRGIALVLLISLTVTFLPMRTIAAEGYDDTDTDMYFGDEAELLKKIETIEEGQWVNLHPVSNVRISQSVSLPTEIVLMLDDASSGLTIADNACIDVANQIQLEAGSLTIEEGAAIQATDESIEYSVYAHAGSASINCPEYFRKSILWWNETQANSQEEFASAISEKHETTYQSSAIIESIVLSDNAFELTGDYTIPNNLALYLTNCASLNITSKVTVEGLISIASSASVTVTGEQGKLINNASGSYYGRNLGLIVKRGGSLTFREGGSYAGEGDKQLKGSVIGMRKIDPVLVYQGEKYNAKTNPYTGSITITADKYDVGDKLSFKAVNRDNTELNESDVRIEAISQNEADQTSSCDIIGTDIVITLNGEAIDSSYLVSIEYETSNKQLFINITTEHNYSNDITSFNELKGMISRAEADKQNGYYGNITGNVEAGEDISIPANLSLSITDNGSFTVKSGCMVSIDGGVYMQRASLVVEIGAGLKADAVSAYDKSGISIAAGAELSLTGNIKADTGSAISGVECGRITRVNEYIICDQAQLDRIIDVSMPNEYFGSRLENTLIICADVIISANFKLSANDSVEIAKHGKLTIAEQAQLDLSGSMRVQEGGSVIIDGKLVCSGSIAVAKGGSLIAAEEAEYINTGSEFYEQGSHVVWNNRCGVMNANSETRIMCCKKQRYSSEANADYITTNAGSLTCVTYYILSGDGGRLSGKDIDKIAISSRYKNGFAITTNIDEYVSFTVETPRLEFNDPVFIAITNKNGSTAEYAFKLCAAMAENAEYHGGKVQLCLDKAKGYMGYGAISSYSEGRPFNGMKYPAGAFICISGENGPEALSDKFSVDIEYSLLGQTDGISIEQDDKSGSFTLIYPEGLSDEYSVNVLAKVNDGCKDAHYYAFECILEKRSAAYDDSGADTLQQLIDSVEDKPYGGEAVLRIDKSYNESIATGKALDIYGKGTLNGSIEYDGSSLILSIGLSSAEGASGCGVINNGVGTVYLQGRINGFECGAYSTEKEGVIQANSAEILNCGTGIRIGSSYSSFAAVEKTLFENNGLAIEYSGDSKCIVRNCRFIIPKDGYAASCTAQGTLDMRYNYFSIPYGRRIDDLFTGTGRIDYSVFYADEAMSSLAIGGLNRKAEVICSIDKENSDKPIAPDSFIGLKSGIAKQLKISLLDENDDIALTWSFYKDRVKDTVSLNELYLNVSGSLSDEALALLSGQKLGPFQPISFRQKGSFPAEADVTVKANEEISGETGLYLYRIEPEGLKLVDCDVVLEKGAKWLTIKGLNSGGDYIVTAGLRENSYLFGDINQDGLVDKLDAEELCRLIAYGTDKLSRVRSVICDTNEDKSIDVVDLALLCTLLDKNDSEVSGR